MTESGGHISNGPMNDNLNVVALLRLTGNITGTGNGIFEKAGGATLELTGNNTFSGTVRIAGGIVRAQDHTNLGTGNISINSSMLLLSGNATFGPNRHFHFGTASSLGPNPALSLNPSTTTVIQGDIFASSSQDTIQKFGAGTLVIEGLLRTDGLVIANGGPSYRQSSSGGEIIFRGEGRYDGSGLGSTLLNRGGGVFDTNGQNVIWTGSIGGLGGVGIDLFTKTGAGILTHNNTNENRNFNQAWCLSQQITPATSRGHCILPPLLTRLKLPPLRLPECRLLPLFFDDP